MIKEKLCVLASCIIITTQAQSAIVAGTFYKGSSSLVLGLIASDDDYTSYPTYYIEVAANADSLIGGESFSYSLSSTASFYFNNHAESWILFSNYYDEGIYISDSSNSTYGNFGDKIGTLYADNTPFGPKAEASQVIADMSVLRGLLIPVEGVDEGGVNHRAPGDFDSYGAYALGGIRNDLDEVVNIYYNHVNPIQRDLDPLESQIMHASGGELAAWFEGTTLHFGTPVPIPATAWLFGSALIGLARVKRQK